MCFPMRKRVKPSNWGTKGYRGVFVSVAPSSGQVSRCSFLFLPLYSGELVNVSPACGDVTAASEKRHGGIHCHARPMNVVRSSEMKVVSSLWKPKSDCKPPALQLDSSLGTNTMSASAVFVLDLKGKVILVLVAIVDTQSCMLGRR